MECLDFVWLGITILAAIVEAAVPSLVSIWFVPGGLAALIASLLGAEMELQIALFLVVSCIALVITRPLAKKMQDHKKVSTNADMVLGRTAVVTEDIDNVQGTGRAIVMGKSWSARAQQTDGVIPAGENVTVLRIEGVKLIVSKNIHEKGEE